MSARFSMVGLLLLLVFFTACTVAGVFSSTPAARNDQLALQAIVDFLDALHAGDYEKAASLYGGTYKTMIDQNPAISPNDPAALLRNACTINGAQCLQAKNIVLDEKESDSEFVYRVEFEKEDGSLFVQGPCCGTTDTEERSNFLFGVSRNAEGKFVVMDMVPYVP